MQFVLLQVHSHLTSLAVYSSKTCTVPKKPEASFKCNKSNRANVASSFLSSKNSKKIQRVRRVTLEQCLRVGHLLRRRKSQSFNINYQDNYDLQKDSSKPPKLHATNSE